MTWTPNNSCRYMNTTWKPPKNYLLVEVSIGKLISNLAFANNLLVWGLHNENGHCFYELSLGCWKWLSHHLSWRSKLKRVPTNLCFYFNYCDYWSKRVRIINFCFITCWFFFSFYALFSNNGLLMFCNPVSK